MLFPFVLAENEFYQILVTLFPFSADCGSAGHFATLLKSGNRKTVTGLDFAPGNSFGGCPPKLFCPIEFAIVRDGQLLKNSQMISLAKKSWLTLPITT